MSGPQIDDASYVEGGAAFATGASLRSIVDAMLASDTGPSEIKSVSAAIGFADALLDLLRKPVLIGNPAPLHGDAGPLPKPQPKRKRK